MTHHYCTYFDSVYKLKGLALYHSLCRYEKDFCLHILALDDGVAKLELPHTTVTVLDELETTQLLQLKTRRSWREYIFTLTPFWVERMLYQVQFVTYLDADMYAYGSLDAAFDEVSDANIAIVPHRFDAEHKFRERDNGIYNLAFLPIRLSETALKCLTDWKHYCVAKGDDQTIWSDLVPKYNVYSILNLGVDNAPWCGYQYHYTEEDRKVYVTDGVRTDQLLLYHFHEFQHMPDGTMTRRTNWTITDEMVELIYKPYEAQLKEVANEIIGHNAVVATAT